MKQLISTAPRDGTWVLIGGGTTSEDFYEFDEPWKDTKRPVVAMWDTEWADGRWAYDFWDGDWRSSYENPTWWMPLPE